MATIDSLGISITQMGRRDLFRLLHTIRAKRRERPVARKASSAKSRAKKSSKTKDPFAIAGRMTQTQKDQLAAILLKEMLND